MRITRQNSTIMKKTLLVACALLMWFSTIQAQIFYKVSGNGLEKPSYLFGTHHMAPLSVIDSIPGVRQALADVDQVVGEIDMTPGKMQLAASLQPFMIAPSDSTLRDLIAPADFDRIAKKIEKYAPMPGITLDALNMLRPTAVEQLVTVSIVSKELPDYNPNEQIDEYFQKEGKNNGKKIIGLETSEMQAKLLFTSIPLTTQASELVEILDADPEELIAVVRELNKSYLAQDLEALLKLSEQELSNSEFEDAILDRRNADWLTKLPDIFKQGSSFVAVGALHLAGDKGIIEGLRKSGYTVEPIMKH